MISSVHTDSLDTTAISHYLEAQVAGFGRLQKMDKFPDGQSNPTYQLETSTGQFVVRMQPAGKLLKSAHAVDREFHVMQALQNSDVPVPEVLHLCTDLEIIGRKFFVMRYVAGRVFWHPLAPEVNNTERSKLYAELNRVLAALHSVDIESVGLGDFGKPGNYYERQISRWTDQYRATQTRDINAMDELIDWLPKHIPPNDGQVSLIHGDYRIDNILFSRDNTAAAAVLDWELSTLGHPYADLAYQCMQWRLATDAVVPGLGEHDRSAMGIPTETEYVEQYCERRGIGGIDNWPFYLAFGFFRFAAIVQGVQKRAIDGNASNSKAMAYGDLAPVLSQLAVDVLAKDRHKF